MRYRTSHETLTESQIKEQLNTLASSDLKFCFTTNYNTPSRHIYKSTMLFFEKSNLLKNHPTMSLTFVLLS